ncbi:Transcriptional regulator, LysR family [Caenispirillum salinarum AK4]|uniref:Transcriptional regulator, LysR family n=1 Tax=Caenispirillum salinarum AK4 TaxID=1238182 RepID=K9GZ66_9PROT|nr:LysR family transcriptional regulator [Caenispirillum salinarum]EKV30069.1 Transcriptional regulator, LysR family [Caenispirillum salinarum AK4]
MDKLALMRTFRRVVERGSFVGAARDLGLSSAAVSKHVSELERQLGASLLSRTTRRLSITEAGRAYHARCVRILDDIDEAEAAVSALQGAPRGVLRVNAPMSFGLRHVSPMLPDFMARYPDVRVDVVMTDRVVDVVEEGFDVALRIRAELPDSSLIARRLATVRRILCAAPAYLDAHGHPTAPGDLPGHRCLLYSQVERPDVWVLNGPEGTRPVQVPGVMKADSSLVLRDALLACMGITLIPAMLVEDDIAAGRLARVLPDHQGEPRTLFAVYPPGRHLSPKTRAFVDFLAERLGGAGAL